MLQSATKALKHTGTLRNLFLFPFPFLHSFVLKHSRSISACDNWDSPRQLTRPMSRWTLWDGTELLVTNLTTSRCHLLLFWRQSHSAALYRQGSSFILKVRSYFLSETTCVVWSLAQAQIAVFNLRVPLKRSSAAHTDQRAPLTFSDAVIALNPVSLLLSTALCHRPKPVCAFRQIGPVTAGMFCTVPACTIWWNFYSILLFLSWYNELHKVIVLKEHSADHGLMRTNIQWHVTVSSLTPLLIAYM